MVHSQKPGKHPSRSFSSYLPGRVKSSEGPTGSRLTGLENAVWKGNATNRYVDRDIYCEQSQYHEGMPALKARYNRC